MGSVYCDVLFHVSVVIVCVQLSDYFWLMYYIVSAFSWRLVCGNCTQLWSVSVELYVCVCVCVCGVAVWFRHVGVDLPRPPVQWNHSAHYWSVCLITYLFTYLLYVVIVLMRWYLTQLVWLLHIMHLFYLKESTVFDCFFCLRLLVFRFLTNGFEEQSCTVCISIFKCVVVF